MPHTWTTETGPRYRCQNQDRAPFLEIHQDLSTYKWRVSYANGRNSLHSGIDGARREAQQHMNQLGEERSLDFIVQ